MILMRGSTAGSTNWSQRLQDLTTFCSFLFKLLNGPNLNWIELLEELLSGKKKKKVKMEIEYNLNYMK